jgi:hypothetical protein
MSSTINNAMYCSSGFPLPANRQRAGLTRYVGIGFFMQKVGAGETARRKFLKGKSSKKR